MKRTPSEKDLHAAKLYIIAAFVFASTGVLFFAGGLFDLGILHQPMKEVFFYFAFGFGFELLATLIATGAIGKNPVKEIVINWSLFFATLLIASVIFLVSILKLLHFSGLG
jgi:hypothetical protein